MKGHLMKYSNESHTLDLTLFCTLLGFVDLHYLPFLFDKNLMKFYSILLNEPKILPLQMV